MNHILLPIIRNIVPSMFFEDLCSVQPMSEEAGELFRMTSMGHGNAEEFPKGGMIQRHVFGRGWEVLYHGQWIPQDLWWKLKIKGF